MEAKQNIIQNHIGTDETAYELAWINIIASNMNQSARLEHFSN